MSNQINLDTLLHEITTRAANSPRFLIAIAGPPSAGKSTLAAQVFQHLPSGTAGIVPMDGFHYDNAVLSELGLRDRKGSPETFDFHGFAALLNRLRRCEPSVAVPLFDRTADLSRAAAALIHNEVKYIIVEGNYLLLNQPPWTELTGLFDLTIYIDVPRDELRRRLLQRWLDLDYPPAKAEHWVGSNDMPNVDLVAGSRRPEDLRIQSAIQST